MKSKICYFIAGVLLLSFSNGFAQEAPVALSAEQIVEKANLAAYYSAESGSAQVKMTITDAQDRSRVREFKILRLDIEDGGAQKFFVYFKKPADVSKMTYMVWKYTDKDDDRWLYLPALDLVRRIAAADKRSSFVGSHFVYEDVSGRGILADVHELLEVTDTHYKIKSTPKETDGVDFAYYHIMIRVDNFIPEKMEYFNEKNELMRSVEALEIVLIDEYPTVIRSVAKDLIRGGQTVMEFSDVTYDLGLGDNLFTERYLRRAPAQWIR